MELAGYVNTTQKEWCDKIREMTGGKGVGVAFDCVGGGLGTNGGTTACFLHTFTAGCHPCACKLFCTTRPFLRI
jgi:hypothetical protein